MDPDRPDPFREDGRRLASIIGLVFGALLHAIVGVFVFTSGLVVPALAWSALLALWGIAAWAMWSWRRQPVVVLLVPLATGAVWWATLLLGDRVLGWTP